MYLLHATNNFSSLKSILKDGCIKSYSKLIKEGKRPEGQGSGIYKENPFVYFSCSDTLFDKKATNYSATLYFNSKLLYHRQFYVSTMHSCDPEILFEEETNYKRKYDKEYRNYNSVLKKLHKQSIAQTESGIGFQIFNQIAIHNKVNLDELVGIEFKIDPPKSLLTYINKYYPDVKIIVNPYVRKINQ